jgi:hypothetical protein
MVLAKVDSLELDIDIKNVSEEGVTEELIERGGKKQEPFLYDVEHGGGFYESADIVDHLEKYHKKQSAEGVGT